MKQKLLAGLLALFMLAATACGADTTSGIQNEDGAASAEQTGAEASEAADVNEGGEEPAEEEPTQEALTPYEMLLAAQAAQENATNMAMDMLMNLEMESGGEQIMAYVMQMEFAIDAEDADNLLFAMDSATTVDVMGQSQQVDMETFYVDGYYYISMEDQKLKVELPIDDAMAQVPEAEMDFEEKYIISQKAEGNVLTFVLEGEAMTQTFDEAMGDMLYALDGNASIEYSDADYIVHLSEDGQIETIEMGCVIEVMVEGEVFTATMHMQMGMKQLGGVEVQLPDDLDSYTEMDASAMGL